MKMTDVHCHLIGDAERHLVCDPLAEGFDRDGIRGDAVVFFHGVHPWNAETFDEGELRRKLLADPRSGVGEIGLDRLKSREIGDVARSVFEAQLAIAAELARPVTLHGAKCWGEVVKALKRHAPRIPAFLFHGFSRSDGLLPEIAAVNGFISVGPAILNDHAENYRRLAAKIPDGMLLVETDRTDASAPRLAEVAQKLAAVRGCAFDALCACLEANADRFLSTLPTHTKQ